MAKNDNEWYHEWQRVTKRIKANESESDFRFQNETIMQCITTIYLAMSFWKYNVKQNICWNSHRRCSIKKLLLKLLQYSQENNSRLATLLKRDSNKEFSCEFCEIFRTPILKNICEWLLLHLFLIKTRDAFAAAKIFIKLALKIDE